MTHTVLRTIKNFAVTAKTVPFEPVYQYEVGMYAPNLNGDIGSFYWQVVEVFDSPQKAYVFCSFLNGGSYPELVKAFDVKRSNQTSP